MHFEYTLLHSQYFFCTLNMLHVQHTILLLSIHPLLWAQTCEKQTIGTGCALNISYLCILNLWICIAVYSSHIPSTDATAGSIQCIQYYTSVPWYTYSTLNMQVPSYTLTCKWTLILLLKEGVYISTAQCIGTFLHLVSTCKVFAPNQPMHWYMFSTCPAAPLAPALNLLYNSMC